MQDEEKSEEEKKTTKNALLDLGKDEFGYAISWKRAFSNIYTRLTWLYSFAEINTIAA